ncbi:protein late bloomer [Zeugodacus cucurbitae]|uniref:Protein late bloomer n=1 Tax=Zeugodacus cucurbitae TaxID=28588 RepID=A0A0A1XP61_ZEUCU|nr:protein late bloomer [Zeugodacus cucurbitae]
MALTTAFSRSCLQWAVIVFSTLSLIIGVLSVVACIFELEKFTDSSAEYREKLVQLAAVSLLTLSSFVGCLGAVNGSVRILCCYITLLITLIASHIWKLHRYNEDKQMTATEKILTSAWMSELVKKGAMDPIHEAYECCGFTNSLDYVNHNMKIPLSCYRSEGGLRSIYPFEEGCLVALKRSYMSIYRYERLGHSLLIGFEVIGILISLLLICKLLTKSRRYSY